MTKIIKFPKPKHIANKRFSYELYLKASEIDSDDLDKSLKLYLEAIKYNPWDDKCYTNLANIYFKKGLIEGAKLLYNKAIELNDKQPEAYYNIGYLLSNQGKYSEAAEYYEKSLKYEPEFSDALYNLAMCYIELDDLKKSKKCFQKFLKLCPNDPLAYSAKQELMIINNQLK